MNLVKVFKLDLVKAAALFAENAHRGQTRKYTGDPYFNHCRAVADSVENITQDKRVIAAAYLHDVLEDTDTMWEELLIVFGGAVTDIVCELTDVFTSEEFPYLSRALRKEMECRRLATISNEAKLIKVWDIHDNTGTIVERDLKFAKVYLVEKEAVLEAIT